LYGIHALPIHNHGENSAAKARLITALGQGRLIGMTGAGLSFWAGYPLWTGALRHLADFAIEATGDAQRVQDLVTHNQKDLLFCAQRLGRLVGDAQFAGFIEKEFGPNGKATPKVLLYFALLPLRHVLTLNFDMSCEQAYDAVGLTSRSLSSANRDELISFFRDLDEPDVMKTVFHLHGRFNEPLPNIVFTEAGYQRLYSSAALYLHHFKNLAVSKSLLFAGFGFADNDVEQMFYQATRVVKDQFVDEPVHYHFAIIGLGSGEGPNHDDRAMRQYMTDRYLSDAVFYNVRDVGNPHAEFEELLKELTDALHLAPPDIAQPIEPQPEMVPIEDIQRMAALSDRFLERVDRGQEND
jgi:hypothetical protein